MPALLAFLSILTIASSASASPSTEMALGAAQLQLDERRDLLDENSQLPDYRWAAFTQITAGGRDGGDLGAGAAGAVSGLGCDLASGTVHGRLRPAGDKQKIGGEASYSFCLSKVGISVVFDGVRSAGIAPAIGAKRSLWNRRYSSTYDRMTIAFGEIWKPKSLSRHTISPISMGHGTTTQQDGLETRTIKELDLDFALYRYRHLRGWSFETLVLTSQAMKAGSDNRGAVTSAFLPVRLRYETPEHYFSAQAGWGIAGGQFSASGSTELDGKEVSSWSETIDSAGLPEMTRPVGALEIGMLRGRLSARASLSNGFYPTFDGALARESRASATLEYSFGETRPIQVAMSPFATSTRTWTRDHIDSQRLAAGSTFQVGRALSKELRLEAIGALGTSPYTRLEGERLASSSFGGQMMVALSGRMAR